MCCGCGACYTACPHKAISMRYDNEGFEYPFINVDVCVDCGLCKKVCPVIQYDNRREQREANNSTLVGYAARNKNLSQRLISSSGSIFPPIAEWIIKKGGIVVGTAYDNNYNTKHLVIDSVDDLKFIQGSKYLQCKADISTFKQIRDELKKERLVFYSGMACQVEGLKSYLIKDYENLYTADLICMGIPSPIVWQKYIKAFFDGEEIQSINFKEKSNGWNSFSFCVETNKRVFKESGMRNLYLQSMFRTWNIRPSCFSCPFKKITRLSDFTLADCWGANSIVPQLDDNKGLSSVIVHSEKGYKLWNELSNSIDFVEIPIEEISKGNSNLVSNKNPSGKRNLFYTKLNKNPREAFVELCTVRDDSIINKIKQIVKNYCHMKISKVFSKQFWIIKWSYYRETFAYDLQFNASFRGEEKLSYSEKNSNEIRYIKCYRKAQAARGTIWYYIWYYRRLKNYSIKTGIGLYENLNIPKGLIIGHAGTIVINGAASFSENIMLTHGVTIGRDLRGKRAGTPTFGKNVCIRCNSTVVGKIVVGDDVLIAPNTFVNFDVPSHSIVIGNPASIHHRDNATEGHIGKVEL